MNRANRPENKHAGIRYSNIDELKAAVREQCLAEWKAITQCPEWPAGQEWRDSYAADFQDRVLSSDEAEAQDIAAQLATALRRTLTFYAAPHPHSYRTSVLNRFVQARLGPFLALGDEFVRLPDGRPNIDPSSIRILDLAAAPEQGWEVAVPARVVALLSDKLRYWQRFGLQEPASNRSMAVFALLIGEFPDRAVRTLMEKHGGVTVAEVIEAEVKTIGTARQRHEERAAEYLSKVQSANQ